MIKISGQRVLHSKLGTGKIKFWFCIMSLLSILFFGCDIFSNARTFQDKDAGFSIKIPKDWKKVDRNIMGEPISEEYAVYMDTDTMADMFMFAKIGIPAEYADLSIDELLKTIMPERYSNNLFKTKLNGNTVFTFIDTVGVWGDMQGGFVWVKNNTLYYTQVRVRNGNLLKSIYQSARLQ